MDILNPHHKTKIHILQLFLVTTIIGFSIPRFFLTAGSERLKESTLGLAMGAKSLLIILYQLLCEHIRRFQRWGSPRAYLILNTLEIILWAAVVFIVLAANVEVCEGMDCALGWVVVSLAVLMSFFSIYAAALCYLDYQLYRRTGKCRGGDCER